LETRASKKITNPPPSTINPAKNCLISSAIPRSKKKGKGIAIEKNEKEALDYISKMGNYKKTMKTHYEIPHLFNTKK
jgi:hypothetical protein